MCLANEELGMLVTRELMSLGEKGELESASEPQEVVAEETPAEEHKNKVELLEICGNDSSVAESAWVSTLTELTEEKLARIPGFVGDLWRLGHTSCFESVFLKFRVKVDAATKLQLLRHRHMSFNSQSYRYKESREDSYYVPTDEAWTEEWQELLKSATESCFKLYHRFIADGEERGIPRSRLKESGRYFLPMSIQYEMIISMNLLAFLKFLELRDAREAQVEIREIAAEMKRLVIDHPESPLKHTMEAFETKRGNSVS